jgi:cytoskeleton protein RodZ
MSAERSEQVAAPDNGHTIPGRILAAQRETMGWSVEQVADQLKLATRQVVALEQGDYSALPGPAVVRGFVRAYAKVVRLDAVPLVAMIALETPAPNDATTTTVRRDKPAAFSEVRFPTNGKRRSLPLGMIAFATALLLAAGAAWQFDLIPSRLLGVGAPATPATNTPAAPAASVPAPVAASPAEPVLETTLANPAAEQELTAAQKLSVPLISVPPPSQPSNGVNLTPQPAVAGVSGVVPPAAPVAAPLAAPAAAPGASPALPGAPGLLVLKMRDNSWVEVRPVKGAPVLKGLMRRGSTETVTVAGPLTLVVGNPAEVDATWRGAALSLPPKPGSTISRVNLN